MKAQTNALLSVLVPIFGLISCTQTERTSNVERIPDPWKLSTPYVIGSSQARPLLETLAEPVDVSAEISFQQDSRDFEGVRFAMDMTCKTAIGAVTKLIDMEGRNSFKLHTILPEHLLNQLDYPDSPIPCTLTAKATNRLGSTHKFGATVFVSNLESIAIGSVLPSTTQWQDSRPEQIQSAFEAYIPNRVLDKNTVGLKLICENFQNTRKVTPGQNIKTIINDLYLGALYSNGEEASLTTLSTFDPRQVQPQQRCRTLFKIQEEAGLTSEYPTYAQLVRFPVPAISVKVHYPMQSDGTFLKVGPLNETSLMTIEIANRSDVHAAIRLPLKQLGTAKLSYVQHQQGQAYIRSTFSTNIQWRKEGFSSEQAADEVLEIAPGKTAKVNAIFDNDLTCWFPGDAESYDPKKTTGFTGFHYEFSSGFEVERLINWNTLKPNVASPREAVTVDNRNWYFQFKQGWISNPLWIAAQGSDEAPSSIIDEPMPMGAFGTCWTAGTKLTL